ncbi:leucine-rich repeat-containing protein 4 [Elsinoe australis]|uniref:Leucine-rich repeat-containing protein 4 n=1 Tax=Elsinoe australis TaxID=40998 RepID=A0A4V6DW51_9PEZI|nr:leucine-rich repeat-containing protein 4 [Elsinoe australis]
MDYSRGPPSPVKSGLPRFSKLPTPQPSRTVTAAAAAPPQVHAASTAKPLSRTALTSPTKAAASIKPPSSTRRVSGIPPPTGLVPRPSSSQAIRSTSPIKSSRLASKPPTSTGTLKNARQRPKSIQIGPSYGDHLEDVNDRLGALSSFSSSSRHGTHDQLTPSPGSSPLITDATAQPRKVSRPSLSDRTKESLARLPGTPASDRRRSGIFSPESPGPISPMGPPARPASAMSMTKRSAATSNIKSLARPTLSVKKPLPGGSNPKRSSVDYSRPAATRRSISATIPRPPPASSIQKTGLPPLRTKSSTPRPRNSNNAMALATGPKPQPSTGRTPAAKNPPPTRFSLSPEPPFEDSESSIQDDQLQKNPVQPASKFRAAIEKAKAAHQAARTHFHKPGDGGFDLQGDPFNQRPRKNENSVLQRRIDTARREGKLNISSLDLSKVPDLILEMYESKSMADSGIAWHETVDLTVVNGAENSISSFSDDLFPEVDPEDAVHDDNLKASVFAGVERMDFRGNQLMALPKGIHFLRRLTTLNLARNQLGNSAFEILIQMSSLKELVLTSNNLSGFLPQSLKSLKNLEVLDVSDNKILNIPDSIHELSKLRILNAALNQLTGVPMDALEDLPITELDVSGNALVGALFPFSVSGLQSLQQLNVANNSLASLAFSESVSLPNIRILKVSHNRMVNLPDMSGWSELVTLAAGGNKFNQLPQGFVSLRRLRHADFSSNDLTRIDERVALMDNLESFVLSANPLVERRFLSMSADSIKRALRPRLESVSTTSVRSSGSFVDEAIDVRSPEESSSPFKITPGGALDLTAQGLVDDDADGLRSLLGQNDVRSLSLPRNKLTMIPYEISLAQNLTFLDLSLCDLAGNYLDERLTLPMLQELQLSGNKIASLEPLVTHLSAPYLQQLDLSNNRLAGELPILRHGFPHLTKLYAADNKIEQISMEALKGLEIAVLPRNSLRSLPADIGLLWFEGLRQLDVSSNYFRVPNYETLNKGTEATLSWLRTRIPGYDGVDETF